MENCTLIDESRDKAIPITAQYFRRPLKFPYPSKEWTTERQIWAGNHAFINKHTKTPKKHEHVPYRNRWSIYCMYNQDHGNDTGKPDSDFNSQVREETKNFPTEQRKSTSPSKLTEGTQLHNDL